MLEPSEMNRFFTSWVRWYLSITEVAGSLPMRQVPSRCTPPRASPTGSISICLAPAASMISAASPSNK